MVHASTAKVTRGLPDCCASVHAAEGPRAACASEHVHLSQLLWLDWLQACLRRIQHWPLHISSTFIWRSYSKSTLAARQTGPSHKKCLPMPYIHAAHGLLWGIGCHFGASVDSPFSCTIHSGGFARPFLGAGQGHPAAAQLDLVIAHRSESARSLDYVWALAGFCCSHTLGIRCLRLVAVTMLRVMP